MRNTKKRGLVGAVGAVAAAAALALSGAVAASAAPTIPPGTEGQPTVGKVTIHKSEQGSTAGGVANGLPLDTDPSNPIKGVTFTAEQINSVTSAGVTYPLDLKTNVGWQNAAKLEFTPPSTWKFEGHAATVSKGSSVEQKTGTTTYQDAVFSNLPVGLYLFTETAAPVGVTKSAPWVMGVPLTHPTNLNEWLYDIYVYPKNSTTGVTKTVSDATATKVGDTVSWVIRGEVPKIADPAVPGNFLAPTRYQVKDVLDPRLDLQSITVTLEGSGSVQLVAADYKIVRDDLMTVVTTPSAPGGNVNVLFTEQGLTKLAAAVKAGAENKDDAGAALPTSPEVVVTLNTTVNSVNELDADGNIKEGGLSTGMIKNQALLFPNQASFEDDKPVPSGEPQTRFGDIRVTKVSADDATKKLPGAVFSVATSEADARAGTFISIKGQTQFTTNDAGEVLISGLRASDWANNESVQLGQEGYVEYWLVEVKAAPGYELLAEPYGPVVIASNATAVPTVSVQIQNSPHNGGFQLPLTGGTGTLLLTILGVGILATVIVVARRRQNATAAE